MSAPRTRSQSLISFHLSCFIQPLENKDLLMVQYRFDGEEHSITPAPHGNANKSRAPAYIRTKPSTTMRLKEVAQTDGPKAAFHRVNDEKGGLVRAEAASDLPRNREQAEYFRRGANASQSKKVDSLAILLEECKRQQMSLAEEPFIREVTGAPELRCVLAFDWQLHEVTQFCTNPDEFTVFTADPTFNLGEFNVTVTTYRHLKVVDRRHEHHPIMIGPLLISQSKRYDTYNYFFGKLVGLNKNMKDILAIGTDGEEPLYDGMKNNMNHAIHLRCFGHFRDNCKEKLRESSVPDEIQKDFLSDVFGRRNGDIFEKGNDARVSELEIFSGMKRSKKIDTLAHPRPHMHMHTRTCVALRFSLRTGFWMQLFSEALGESPSQRFQQWFLMLFW